MTNGLTGQTYSLNMIPYSSDSISELICECVGVEAFGKCKYLNIPSAFDTETSSFIDWYDGKETALCYIWMFGIGDVVVSGRYLNEFVSLIESLNRWLCRHDVTLVTFIHFAKFDFSFIKTLFDWDEVFLKANREVLFARYGNIEFRDSLVLSGGQSLANIGKNLRVSVKKAVGDLDYDLIRHNETPLTQKELHYCEMDIRVLCEYIREKIEDDGNISQIPYTNTGYVRRYVRNECFKNRRAYAAYISGLTMTPGCYIQAENCFQGGSVSGNFKYIGKTVEDVHSYDIKSSYPYVMCTGYYPSNYFTEISLTGQTDFEYHLSHSCCMFDVELWDVEPKTPYYFPLHKHKCFDIVAPLSDSDYQESASGRIISAMYLHTVVTELDWETIKDFYTFSNFRVTHFRIAPRGFLPYPIVNSVVKFFNDKTTLDGVEGKERQYMIAKNMLNAVFGMSVEKPVRPIYRYVNGEGFVKDEADFVHQIDAYNEKYNRFLFYPWGVWITAHARYRLHEAIKAVGKDFIYCDTDSVKFIGEHSDWFANENEKAVRETIECAKRNGFAESYIMPYSPDGVRKILGVWEHEYDAYRFKTIGAKRYLVEHSWREKGNKSFLPNESYEFTTSGCHKKKAWEYIKQQANILNQSPFDIFSSSLVVPPEYSGRTVSKYIDTPRSGWVTDYLGNKFFYESPSGVYVTPSSYSFSITDEMADAVIWATHDGHFVDGQV